MQIFSYLCDKALILKRSLTLSDTNTYIWFKESVGPSIFEALN